jgi:CMP-N-acetylneuraminic acid synthetase
MTDNMRKSVLGLIPAKIGSQRFPKKNIQPLRGKPLIQWAAEAGWLSGVIDDLIISTDDLEVVELAESIGLEVPFVRPAHLGRDPAGVENVAIHALEELERQGRSYDHMIILLPTCPLRAGDDIKRAFSDYMKHSSTNLMSVALMEHNPFNAIQLDEKGLVWPVFPELARQPPGELSATYRPNGAIHILNVEKFRRTKSYLEPPIRGYIMPRESSVDIDFLEDLMLAEVILEKRQQYFPPTTYTYDAD